MLTALDRNVDRRHGYETGADDYVTKPFSPQGLVSRLQACLAQCRETRQAGQPLRSTFELAAAVTSLKSINTLTTALFCRTQFPEEPVEALRTGLLRLASAAEEWAATHGGASPARLEVELDTQRLRLVFQASRPDGQEFLAQYLAAEGRVPAEFTDAGIIDRVVAENGAVTLEKSLAPQTGP
jgi:DNA-binding response OmpR family regulator